MAHNPTFASSSSGGGLIAKQAWQSLAAWLEAANPQTLNGWLAIYLEQPEALRIGKSLAMNDSALRLASLKLSKSQLSDQSTLFLFPDNSLIVIFKNQLNLNLATAQKQVENILYENHTASSVISYDLAIQLNNLRMLCKQKQPLINIKNEPMTKSLEDKLLQTELFRQLAKARAKRGKLSILLVEDDKMVAHLLHRTLKEYDVAIAHTANDGLEIYSRTAPDICFMDIGLPDHSGLDLLKIIHDHDPKAFIVMLTANSSEQNFHSSVSQGIKGFIAKPFTLNKISQYIDAFISSRSA